MARRNYNTPKPDYYVTIGGKTKEGVVNPTSLEGYFLGSSTAPDTFNDGKMKTTFLLKDAEGKIAGVNGNANLIFQFEDAKKNLAAEGLNIVGMQTFISYVGERKSDKKGRSPTKLFSLEFDPEDMIEVLGAAAVAEASYEETADESDDLGDVDNEAAEPVTASTAQLSAAERKAKAEELLRKSRARK